VAPIYVQTEARPRRRAAPSPGPGRGRAQRLGEAAAFSRKQVASSRPPFRPAEEAKEELEPLLDAYILMLGNSRLLRGARKRIGEELASPPRPPCRRGRGDLRRHPRRRGDDKSA
jgi:phosphotransferase system enzyme I (PtsI)